MTRKIAAALSVAILFACTDAPAPEPATRPAPAPAASAAAPAKADDRRIVLFVGTSLTAGYGVGADVAFPAVVQQKIDSAGLPFRVVNAGLSGETSAGGLRRIDWVLQHPVDVLVIELGANDALRGLDPDTMRANLDAIVTRTKERYPSAAVIIAGMRAPPNLGDAYARRFESAYRTVARAHGATLIPFVLEGVAAKPELNQEDGMHPTVAGQRIMANTVWQYLEPVLRARAR